MNQTSDKQLINNINKYVLNKDLTELAKCVKLGIRILKTEGFPIEEYEDYLNKKTRIGFKIK